MLTAKTKSGKKFCLGYDYKKETLLYLREKEEFICPICGEEVILKLGEQRIFHFAHKKGGECREFYEAETIYHLEGKRRLYQWLTKQRIPSELEFYDKEIQQRPDIMFLYNDRKYALEYQCSAIPDHILTKRTNSYLENGYLPIWILGSKRLHEKKKNIAALSSFHYLFIRTSPNGSFYLPSYCSERRQFQILGPIQNYSIKNAMVKSLSIDENRMTLSNLLSPIQNESINIMYWKKELEKAYWQWALHPGPHNRSFLHEIYNHHLNPFLLPPQIGLYVPHSILIKTSPVIWQTYIYLDVLSSRLPGDIIRIGEVERKFIQRTMRKDIILRNLPQMKEKPPFYAVVEFLALLEKMGFIEKTGDTIYRINRCLNIPATNQEKEAMDQNFLQKYRFFLAK